MTGGSERWPDLGSQNERLVVPLADQDERLVDPQTARQAGLPVEPRPLVPRSRPAADDESERLLRGYLSHALFDAGLICRADDRGDPVIQLSPPLTCTQEHFTEIAQILRGVLTEAWSRL